MSFTSALVLYIVIWAIVFYMINPLWQVSQAEDGHVVPGTPESAPVDPKVGKKAFWTTVWASLVFGVAYWVIESGIISLDDLAYVTLPSDR